MVRQLTSVWYSGLVSASQTQISLCHNLLLGCQIILRFVQSTIISKFGTHVLHINAEKPLRLDFQNLYYLFFTDFMFENLELTCHLTSFHDEFIVAPSRWKPPDADAASVCRESTQILQDRETCSQSMQAPLTLKVKPLLISTYTFGTNIRWNKIAIYSVRFDVKSTWFDSLLCHCAIPFNEIPPLVSCIPRWGMPNLRCRRNGSLDNDDTEKGLCLSTLHKWNQQIWHRSRTPIFLSFLSAVDRKSVRIYCAQCRLFTVSVSLSAAWK